MTRGVRGRVAVLDYGAGNLHSLAKALEAQGARAFVTANWDEALAADALALPGVGSWAAAVGAIEGERERVRAALQDGLPCLGICLGMQLLFEESAEGGGPGIGLLPGRVVRLSGRTVPQIGWNDVDAGDDPLFRGVRPLSAYFANSYVCRADDPAQVTATSDHEGELFAAGVRRGRAVGVQFHPEKSSKSGLRLIANFLDEALGRDGTGGDR